MAAGLGAALDGEAVGLVDGDDHVVLVEHEGFGELYILWGQGVDVAGLARGVVGDRRDAHGGAGGQTALGLDAGAIDADLAAAGHLLHLDVGQVRPAPPEPAVQPNAVLGLGDIDRQHLAPGGGFGLLNGFVSQRAAPKARRATIRPIKRAAIDRTTEAAT